MFELRRPRRCFAQLRRHIRVSMARTTAEFKMNRLPPVQTPHGARLRAWRYPTAEGGMGLKPAPKSADTREQVNAPEWHRRHELGRPIEPIRLPLRPISWEPWPAVGPRRVARLV